MKQLSNPTHVANKGYSSFPIRQRKQFSSTVGHILPIYYDYLSPGDKVSCGAEVFTRFQPMVAPFMGELEEHIDWFFVPMDQIYSYFGDAFYGIQDFKNDFVGANTSLASQILPSFDSSVLRDQFAKFRNGTYSATASEILDADNTNIFRLLDHLGFPVKQLWIKFFAAFSSGTVSAGWWTKNVNIWFAAAYQKIWSDHYRLDDWQENDSFLYNFDSFALSATARNVFSRFQSVFSIHRIPYKRDYFTYSLPSPIFNNHSFNSIGDNGPSSILNSVNQWLTNVSGINVINTGGSNANFDNATTIGTISLLDVQSVQNRALSPATLRTAFAMEKMLEITRRAPKHYDSQTLAHFGINVPTGLSGESFFLGGMTVKSHVNDIFSTAQTDSTIDGNQVLTPLGEMAGKGYFGGSKGNIRFEAKCHGILMAVFYVLPDVVYEQSGLDRLNSYLRVEDFMKPEYDDLGMQPLFQYEVDINAFAGSLDGVVAWKYRYSELKSKYDVCFGAFSGDMNMWTLSRQSVVSNNNSNVLNWSALTVQSNLLNQVMLVQYLGNVPASSNIPDLSSYTSSDSLAKQYGEYVYNQIYSRDPLLHDVNIFVNKASKMSQFGLPSL